MTAHSSQWTPDAYATDAERRADGTILLTPRGQIAAYPERLLDALEHWARVAPNRVLVARRDQGVAWRKVMYADMLARVRRVATGLIARDLSPERPIAILSGNSIEHLTIALAAMWAGIPYCPISPSYSLVAGDFQKLNHVWELLTPGLCVAFDTPQFVRAIEAVVPATCEIVGDAEIAKRRVVGLEDLARDPSSELDQAHAGTGADTIAKFLLTSGSTGLPKAVITTQRMMCANAVMVKQAMPFLADAPPVLVDWLPWNHTFGGSHNVGLTIANGGTLYIDEGKPTPSSFSTTVRNLHEISPTVYFNVPKGFEMLVQHLRNDASLRKKFYSRLRAYFFAGASLPQHVWDELDVLSIAELGFKVPMLSGLGATETGPSVTFTTPVGARAGVIGLPAAGNVVKLAPVGDKLEIRARGPNVTPGYWRHPELTAAAFDDEGFYRLGDAVRMVDPEHPTRGLKFDGRIAEDFKLSSGTWVSVGPLRAEVLNAFAPLLQDVVIAGIDLDYLSALLIPDLGACASALNLQALPTFEELASHAQLHALLAERLRHHAKRNPSSSLCIRRAMLLPTAPSLDAGEITDKGSINQRAVLKCRSELVATLFTDGAASGVISVT